MRIDSLLFEEKRDQIKNSTTNLFKPLQCLGFLYLRGFKGTGPLNGSSRAKPLEKNKVYKKKTAERGVEAVFSQQNLKHVGSLPRV
jgi:hypothetical protein